MKLFLILLFILMATYTFYPTEPSIDSTPVCTYDEYYFYRPDVLAAEIDALDHYQSHGKEEGMCYPEK